MLTFQMNLRSLGLSEGEAALLLGVAESVAVDVRKHVAAHHMTDAHYIDQALTTKLENGIITKEQKTEYLVAGIISTYSPEHFLPLSDKSDKILNGDSFIKHPSFGSVNRNAFVSNTPRVFGSPSSGRNMVSMTFARGRVAIDDQIGSREPYLREAAQIFDVHFTFDQFSSLIRGKDGMTTCAIESWEFKMLDQPPRMVSSFDNVDDVLRRAKEICDPVYEAVAALEVYLKDAEKISSKGDYAELVSKAEAIRLALLEATEPMRALMRDAAGTSAEAASRQLIADLVEPLKALGMDADGMLLKLY